MDVNICLRMYLKEKQSKQQSAKSNKTGLTYIEAKKSGLLVIFIFIS